MNEIWLLAPILIPIITGLVILLIRPEKRIVLWSITATGVCITSIVIFLLILYPPARNFVFFSFGEKMVVSLGADRMSCVFAALIGILWPLTTFYSFEYMKHEGKENKFFCCFVITYGVVAGIAFAGSMITMYFFYELMTLITLPMVMHAMDKKAIYAGKKYLILSMTGAALVFVSLIGVYHYCTTMEFLWGGVLAKNLNPTQVSHVRVAFTLAFFGFGVKAAILPFSSWLPAASVAPTPVSALLHAVAVVKGGVFAIMRLIYWVYGTDILYGTWAQTVVLVVASITIVYGSGRALLTQHLKRRLAYSTISQLSYIILGVGLMTPAGLSAGLTHMIFHAFMKITLFFCAGAILYKTGQEYIYQMKGAGKSMPVIFFCFSLMGLALIGVPPFGGFISKYRIGTAAAMTGMGAATLGIVALIISALLTLFYIISVVAVAWFPERGKEGELWNTNQSVNQLMNVPIIIITVSCILLSLYAGGMTAVFDMIANGQI